jgi:hypothetical protein
MTPWQIFQTDNSVEREELHTQIEAKTQSQPLTFLLTAWGANAMHDTTYDVVPATAH